MRVGVADPDSDALLRRLFNKLTSTDDQLILAHSVGDPDPQVPYVFRPPRIRIYQPEVRIRLRILLFSEISLAK
jgi:hypothetical protein